MAEPPPQDSPPATIALPAEEAVPTDYASLRAYVTRTIIAPDCEREMRDVSDWRFRWRKIGNQAESCAHVLLVVATVLAYSAGYFSVAYLPFLAGCANVLCLALLRFSVFANRESSERTDILNRHMSFLKLDQLPDITAGVGKTLDLPAGDPPLPDDETIFDVTPVSSRAARELRGQPRDGRPPPRRQDSRPPSRGSKPPSQDPSPAASPGLPRTPVPPLVPITALLPVPAPDRAESPN